MVFSRAELLIIIIRIIIIIKYQIKFRNSTTSSTTQ